MYKNVRCHKSILADTRSPYSLCMHAINKQKLTMIMIMMVCARVATVQETMNSGCRITSPADRGGWTDRSKSTTDCCEGAGVLFGSGKRTREMVIWFSTPTAAIIRKDPEYCRAAKRSTEYVAPVGPRKAASTPPVNT